MVQILIVQDRLLHMLEFLDGTQSLELNRMIIIKEKQMIILSW